MKGILFTRMTDRGRQGETGRDREARVPVEYKDTQSSRKKGGGMQVETYRKDPPPLFHRNDVRHPPFSCHPCRLAVPLLEPLHLRLSLILCLSHPLAYPPSRSFLVSDRVPLFRVLYYFFYQSARFQDALRPAESCVINHEM